MVVFQHLEAFSGQLRYKFCNFIKKLSYTTELRLVLVLEEFLANKMMQEDNDIAGI